MPKKKEATIEELKASVREQFKHWKEIKKKGTTDPFWPDGLNMNLVRNHIFYYQYQLKERCKAEKRRPYPMEATLKLPPKMKDTYMAPGSKAAKHTALPMPSRVPRK